MERIFLMLLEKSIDAVPVIFVVCVLHILFGLLKAPKAARCALWALVAVRLLVPVSIASPLSALSLLSDWVRDGETVVEELTEGYVGYYRFVYEDGELYEAAIESGAVPGVDGEGRAYAVTVKDGLTAPKTFGEARVPILARIWLAGAAVMLAYCVFSFLRLRRKTASAVPLRDGLYLCDGVRSPFILGVIRPRIILPSDIAEGQIPAVEAHERAHLKRGDHVWKVLGFLILAVYWFSPPVWLAYIQFCRDIELACDERAIRDLDDAGRKDYAETLLSLSVPGRGAAACPLAFGETAVKERIRAVLRYKKPAAWIVAVVIVLAAAAAVCFLTVPKNRAFRPDEVHLGSMLSSYAVFDSVRDAETVDYLYGLWKKAEIEGTSGTIGRGVDVTATFTDTKTGKWERLYIFPDGVASWGEDFPTQWYILKDGREIYRIFMEHRAAQIESETLLS
ncbi:MAG: M56 family metallopeptidase [Oscillospiraceae bacterium]|nr:M56 family metallopeptidase [Oscillospiraceae bacterium]